MNFIPSSLLIYAVTESSKEYSNELYNKVREALEGGATLIQLREKELSIEDFTAEAKKIKVLCDSYSVDLIINDNLEVALAVDAAGIHIGQSDLPLREVRKTLGFKKIIGVSARTLEDAITAKKDGADYIGVGAMYYTSTKTDALKVSFDTLKLITKTVDIPVCVIGGIKMNNLEEFSDTGIDGFAIVSEIFSNRDIKQITKELKVKANNVLNNGGML